MDTVVEAVSTGTEVDGGRAGRDQLRVDRRGNDEAFAGALADRGPDLWQIAGGGGDAGGSLRHSSGTEVGNSNRSGGERPDLIGECVERDLDQALKAVAVCQLCRSDCERLEDVVEGDGAFAHGGAAAGLKVGRVDNSSAGRGNDRDLDSVLGLLDIGREIRSEKVKGGETVAENRLGLLSD